MPSLHRLVVAAISLAALGAGLTTSALPGQAQTPRHRAGLIVQYADQRTDTRCVEFDEPEISGYELLRRSGLPLVIAPGSFGVAVCKIRDEGCAYPSQSCFCQCENIKSTCIYWISFAQVNGEWKYATLGASNTKVRDGDMQAWVWGAGQADGTSVLPPAMSFDAVCPAPQPTAPAEPATPAARAPVADASPTPAPTSAPQAGAPTEPAGLIAFAGVIVVLGAILIATSRRRNAG